MEPATDTVIHTLTIARAQVVMAGGTASAEAKEFELVATRDSDRFGIRSAPFSSMHSGPSIPDQGKHRSGRTWSYADDTVLIIRGRPEPSTTPIETP